MAKTDIDPIVCAYVISCFRMARAHSPGNVLAPVLQGQWILRVDSERAALMRTQVSGKLFSMSWAETKNPEEELVQVNTV